MLLDLLINVNFNVNVVLFLNEKKKQQQCQHTNELVYIGFIASDEGLMLNIAFEIIIKKKYNKKLQGGINSNKNTTTINERIFK